jgi:sugar-specific transcriptional regulator TrmB
MQLIDRLMSVGLGRHEAELYVLLHREGPMTGYEAAKHSGILDLMLILPVFIG